MRTARRHSLLAALTALATAAGPVVAPPAAQAAGPVPHYVMTAFTNSSESNMYVYDSANATNFSLVRANAYTPPSGLIRDPSVLRHTDGYYYIVYTTGWTGDTIGFARSADYVTWTFLRNVRVGLNGSTGSTWAPEWFRDSDGSVHVIFSASTTGTAGQFRPYRITATSSDLSTWTSPAALGIPANYIDSFVVKSGGTYHNFLKNETTKYIEHATASSLNGPWTFRGTGNWAGWGSGLEGPALVQLPDGRWRLYFDQYGQGRYYYADSSDLNSFGAKVELPGLSGTARHFTVLRESSGDSTTVPTGNRSLRSVNVADRYVRHRDNLGYVEPVSTSTDRQDATFTIVAGLANPNCVSFRSTNFPTRYLRHYNFRIRLDVNGGDATFARDATFCGRAGLAGGTSFESYSHPGRYLRHYDYELRVDLFASGSAFAGDASFTVTSPLATARTTSATAEVRYTNPIAEKRADPHIFRHTDGYYYLTATVPEYDRIVLRRATTIQGLATASETVIWRRHTSGEMGAHIWAPEIHFIDGKWYVYFAAGRADDVWRIRMYVLESSGANPLTGSWVERGRIATPWDTFSLDASTFVANGVRYLTWAQQEPGISTNSNVYLARMGSSPWTITGTVTRLTVPTLSWETRGYRVNEGPSVIQRGGRLFLTYSASATDANYCLGMLTASATANLLNASSWTKSQSPVFASNDATGQYGPGHNSFTVSEDGQSDILVYHDRNYRDISGDPLNDPNRRTRVQKVYWNADGTPNFGIPVPDGATPVRLRSYDLTDRFVRHYDFRARVDSGVNPLADSQFKVVTGLAGQGTVSLESTNFPGYYLRHRDYELWVERNDGSTVFRGDASFTQRTGLASGSGVSFESQNVPGRYVRHASGLLSLQVIGDAAGRSAATFVLE